MKPRQEALALALAFERYAHPELTRDLVAREEPGTCAVGVWLTGTDSRGKKLPPWLMPRPSVAFGRSWREVVTKIRRLTTKRREADAGEWMTAAVQAAAEGHDVREPCAQLWGWISADPLTEEEG